MPNALLITECLQNDFVKLVGEGEPLPNQLHVGAEEARRLMGENPAEGPVARVMNWAYRRRPEELGVIHLRDWHDPEDPFEQGHLQQFGRHCLKGSRGAEFAFEEPPGAINRAEIVNALTLNDFHQTRLPDLLAPLEGRSINVGLIGVWTEAKVTFLAYELATRYPDFRLGVCSALTASSSRLRHFTALEQLERILGVEIFSSVGRFLEFLGGEAGFGAPAGFNAKHPELILEPGLVLEDTDQRLIRYVFRDCRRVSLETLGGGYSGSLVFMAAGEDGLGHRQAPHVIKLGPRDLMARERTAFERIETVLGNNAPRMADFAEMDLRGALKYRYASMRGGNSVTFQKIYESGRPLDQIEDILETVFAEQLGRLYSAGFREEVDLFDYYEFDPKWAPGVRARVEALVGDEADRERLTFPGGKTAWNVHRFYQQTLAETAPFRRPAGRYFAYVHGDLNGANILQDELGAVWLIDFFHTHHGHVLRDLIKLENDLLYIFTKISGPDQLEEALRLTDAMLEIEDLWQAPDDRKAELKDPLLIRAYRTIRILRSFYPGLIHEDRDEMQLLIGQLRYAVHTLSFEEANVWQKKWALYAAGRQAELIAANLKAEN